MGSRSANAGTSRPRGAGAESAREAGIGTGYVDKALSDAALAARTLALRSDSALARAHPGGGVRESAAGASVWAGETKLLDFATVLDGELPERDFDTVIETVRRALGDVGVVSGVGRSMSWSSSDPQRKIQVSVKARDGRTSIRVGERLSPLAGSVFGGVVGGGGGGFGGAITGILMGITQEPIIALPFLFGTVGLSYGAARVIYARIVRKRKRQLRDLTAKIGVEVRGVIERRSAGQGRIRGQGSTRRRDN